MSTLVVNAVVFAFIPAAAVVLGGAAAVLRPPGPALKSATQHFTAGVLFCAVATEILPDVVHRQMPLVMLAAFTVGTIAMLGIRHWAEPITQSSGSDERVPMGLIAATGVDLAIDGLLIGLAFVTGQKQGVLLVIALALEALFVGLSTGATQSSAGAGPRKTLITSSAFAALIVVCAAVAAFLFKDVGGVVLDALLSFGLAALLFLVTEELLVEAHEMPETPMLTAMFFIGFVVLLGIDMYV